MTASGKGGSPLKRARRLGLPIPNCGDRPPSPKQRKPPPPDPVVVAAAKERLMRILDDDKENTHNVIGACRALLEACRERGVAIVDTVRDLRSLSDDEVKQLALKAVASLGNGSLEKKTEH